MPTPPRIALTLGDPAGIGPEIVLAAAARASPHEQARLVLVGDRAVLEACSEELFARPLDALLEVGVTLEQVDQPDSPLVRGRPSAAGGRAAAAYVERACQLASRRQVDAICTAPIDKVALRLAGYPHVDHTSILARHFQVADPLTLFITGRLRIFFLTRHLALKDVVAAIDTAKVATALRRAVRELRALGLPQPRVALAALNPHASDGGRFGDEEERLLAPAVAALVEEGERVFGPVPADAVFHFAAQGDYDAVVSLYHDQGHVAAKTLDFHGTISVTLGLPIVRTSVDHGSAMDIAWQKKADPRSLMLALQAAADLTAHRLPGR